MMKKIMKKMREIFSSNSKPCKTCGKQTEFCPYCHGEDHWGKNGQYDGFWVCHNKDCESYQLCCGC